MPRSRVHEDSRGLYIKLNGGIYRPGDIPGLDHAYDMGALDLQAGDVVRTYHSVAPGQPVCRIKLESGNPDAPTILLVWAEEYAHEQLGRWDDGAPPGPTMPGLNVEQSYALVKVMNAMKAPGVKFMTEEWLVFFDYIIDAGVQCRNIIEARDED